MTEIRLLALEESDREQFILDNQEAFNYGALQEFGRRDDHFEEPDFVRDRVASETTNTALEPSRQVESVFLEEEEQIISRKTIECSIDGGEAYRIWCGDEKVGGVILKVEGNRGDLEILFVKPDVHSKGIGYAAWCAVEKLHPEVTLWETVTPYFEKRNIHFYVNRCGFHIVEFFNSHHPDPNETEEYEKDMDEQFPEGMFRFEKRLDP